MDEQGIKKLILEILQEKLPPDILVLWKGPRSQSQVESLFCQTCSHLGLKVQDQEWKEDFVLPKRALYLTGLSLHDCLDLLWSDDLPYQKIRELGKRLPVFLDGKGFKDLGNTKEEAGFLKSLLDLLRGQGIQVLLPSTKAQDKEEVQGQVSKTEDILDLRGKRILTLRDLPRQTMSVVLVDRKSQMTMALSDWLRDRNVEIRRMRCN